MDTDQSTSGSELFSEDLSNDAIKSKINAGDFKLVNFEGKSKIWEIFQKIENEQGNIVPSAVSCKICKNIYKFNKNSTSNLVKHKCYAIKKIRADLKGVPTEAHIDDQMESVRLFTRWTMQNCRPFKIVEDNGLQNIIQFFIAIGAKYGEGVNLKSLLPHRTTLSRNVNKLYDVYLNEIKLELNSVKSSGFALTSDLWTDNYIRKTYIALTIHYIRNGKIVCRLLGFKSMENERSTGANIESKVLKILDEFDCRPRGELDIVTDRGSNMISGFKNHNRINCVAHLLHNSVMKAMGSIDEIEELCNACSKLVKFFKTNGINSSLKTTLKSFSPTRWNPIYYLFASIERTWAEIFKTLQEKGEFHRVVNIHIADVSAVLKILHPFEDTFKTLEGEKYATIHLVHLYINRLKKKLVADVNDSEIIKKFKNSVSEQLEITVLNNRGIYHRISLFLFPPANKLVHFSKEEIHATKEKCKSLMSMFDQIALSDIQAQTKSFLFVLHSELLGDYLTPAEESTVQDNVSKDLTEYENENVTFNNDFDVLPWWNNNQKRFPLLYKLSCRVLAIPSSSAASERAFSVGRQLISEKRSALGGNELLVGKIMFLHSNIEEKSFDDLIQTGI